MITILVELREDKSHSIIKERPRHQRYNDQDGTNQIIKGVDGICGNYTMKEKPTEDVIKAMAQIVYNEYCPVRKYYIWYANTIDCWRLTFGN